MELSWGLAKQNIEPIKSVMEIVLATMTTMATIIMDTPPDWPKLNVVRSTK